MKVAIIGYSGSGKSTLARTMAAHHKIPALHLDQVYWLPGWKGREISEAAAMVETFLDENDSWVIDGNYSQLAFDRRMMEADQILFLAFGRWACLRRVWTRYRKNRGTTRGDMAEGCPDKVDWAFVRWILWEGRDHAHRAWYAKTCETYGNKCIVIKNQRKLTKFYNKLHRNMCRN